MGFIFKNDVFSFTITCFFKSSLDLVIDTLYIRMYRVSMVVLRDASMIGRVLEQLARSLRTLDFKFSTKS